MEKMEEVSFGANQGEFDFSLFTFQDSVDQTVSALWKGGVISNVTFFGYFVTSFYRPKYCGGALVCTDSDLLT